MYLYQFYIIIGYKYTFINKYFTHLHKTLVNEQESNMDYAEHRPFSRYVDSDFEFDFDFEFDYCLKED